jgi:hypothetical protein
LSSEELKDKDNPGVEPIQEDLDTQDEVIDIPDGTEEDVDVDTVSAMAETISDLQGELDEANSANESLRKELSAKAETLNKVVEGIQNLARELGILASSDTNNNSEGDNEEKEAVPADTLDVLRAQNESLSIKIADLTRKLIQLYAEKACALKLQLGDIKQEEYSDTLVLLSNRTLDSLEDCVADLEQKARTLGPVRLAIETVTNPGFGDNSQPGVRTVETSDEKSKDGKGPLGAPANITEYDIFKEFLTGRHKGGAR